MDLVQVIQLHAAKLLVSSVVKKKLKGSWKLGVDESAWGYEAVMVDQGPKYRNKIFI